MADWGRTVGVGLSSLASGLARRAANTDELSLRRQLYELNNMKFGQSQLDDRRQRLVSTIKDLYGGDVSQAPFEIQENFKQAMGINPLTKIPTPSEREVGRVTEILDTYHSLPANQQKLYITMVANSLKDENSRKMLSAGLDPAMYSTINWTANPPRSAEEFAAKAASDSMWDPSNNLGPEFLQQYKDKTAASTRQANAAAQVNENKAPYVGNLSQEQINYYKAQTDALKGFSRRNKEVNTALKDLTSSYNDIIKMHNTNINKWEAELERAHQTPVFPKSPEYGAYINRINELNDNIKATKIKTKEIEDTISKIQRTMHKNARREQIDLGLAKFDLSNELDVEIMAEEAERIMGADNSTKGN